MKIKLSVLMFLLLFSAEALAQNTGGVFGPVVNDDHEMVQYRNALVPGEDGGPFRFTQRLHYENAPLDFLMWRVVGQSKHAEEEEFTFDMIQGEVFWQATPDDWTNQIGLRFDTTIRDDGRPNTLGLHLMTQQNWTRSFRTRLLGMTGLDLGDDAREGISLQSRAQMAYAFDPSLAAGIELYNTYGTTADPGSFDEQRHQAGAYLNASFTDGWSVLAGILFGLTDASPTADMRLWLSRSL